MDYVKGIYTDMECLVAMWFAKAHGDTHKERLDAFYGRQAHAYDRFRANFLHGRRPMLKELAKQLSAFDGPLSWVDLGGGTGENVAMMADYIDLSRFEKIYVVDLCSPLCDVAKAKAKERGWSNVEVVEGDACTFQPDKKATVVTFSYSLSMIPPYMAAVDNALSMLAPGGLLGVADFYVSGKYDRPQRQHPYYRRWFWQAVFDLDNINLGPERRAYLDHKLDTVVEVNCQGGIPYVPILRAPWYFWIGSPKEASNREQLGQNLLQ